MKQRYKAPDLAQFAVAALGAAGMEQRAADDVAQVLLEGDLLGHDTHGLQLLESYVTSLDKGGMTAGGKPEVISERSAVCVWNGNSLPGPHLVQEAIRWAGPRAREHGCATVVIRRSHHIACLAAYLEAPARAGLMIELLSSDPASASVAPFGGTRAVMTPNPIAYGIPTGGEPIIIDISASVTTNGMTNRLHAAAQHGSHEWWLTAEGQPTNDPAVLAADPPGTILPLGGTDAGHKGYGLGLRVEAATGALAGHGRADGVKDWGASVYLQITDPAAFAGLPAFEQQMAHLVDACHASPARVADSPVRLPGERGLARKRDQLADGVQLHDGIPPALQRLAMRYDLTAPLPL